MLLKWKTIVFITSAFCAVFLFSSPVLAHPGKTASDGCHYCRTNCDKWGVLWNQRHCHGGSASVPTVTPNSTPSSSSDSVSATSTTPVTEVKKLCSNQDTCTAKANIVIDGDTIVLDTGEKVRYTGVDTPETVDPRKPVQCFGKEASDKNKELVEGKEVKLVKDISDKDKYGRLLRYVYVGDKFVNDSLVKDGFAHSSSYPPDIKYQEQFRKSEEEARNNKIGLWADGICGNPISVEPENKPKEEINADSNQEVAQNQPQNIETAQISNNKEKNNADGSENNKTKFSVKERAFISLSGAIGSIYYLLKSIF
jgi:micrococcal nuclease